MRKKDEIFKQILISEELYSSDRVKTIPIDIENSMLGREMNTLISTISGNETVQPYCDVSLRVIMRIADILMFRHEYKYYDIQSGEDIVKELNDYYVKIY